MKNKFKVFLSLEKEEAWLNKQLQEGLELIALPGNLYYQFEERTDSTEKVIRLDYRKFSSKEEFENYLQFMTDSGWKHISGEYNSGVQYFSGMKGDTPELFSDTSSLMAREKRIRNGKVVTLLLLQSYIFLFLRNSFDLSYLHLRKAFLTPGLWEKSGLHFLTSFLFELPFALIRLVVHLGLPIGIVLVIGGLVSAQWHYLNQKNKLQQNL